MKFAIAKKKNQKRMTLDCRLAHSFSVPPYLTATFIMLFTMLFRHRKLSSSSINKINGSAYGIRTRDTALRGLWLNRLPNAPCA